MNNNTYNEMDDELRPEYDLSKLKGGVRGKYAAKYKEGTNLQQINYRAACRKGF
jgi:hypothetical protein